MTTTSLTEDLVFPCLVRCDVPWLIPLKLCGSQEVKYVTQLTKLAQKGKVTFEVYNAFKEEYTTHSVTLLYSYFVILTYGYKVLPVL